MIFSAAIFCRIYRTVS